MNFSALAVTLKAASGEVAAVTLKYGMFIQTIIDFTIIAFVIFLAVKAINRLRRAEAAAPAPSEPSDEVNLLTEIRDNLKNSKQ